MEIGILIIDAHAHIFRQVQGRSAAGPVRGVGFGRVAVGAETIQFMPPSHEQTIFTSEMLLAHMDLAGVDGAVLLQGPFYGECNDYVLRAVRCHPGRLAGCACLDPWEPGSRRAFDRLFAAPGFAGVKLECSEATGLTGLHPSAQLDDEDVAWLCKELERRSLVLVLDLGAVGSGSYQPPAVRGIAESHPGLNIVIAHLGQPTPAVEADSRRWALWRELIDLGRLTNVFFDCAALPAYVPGEAFPFPSVGRYLHDALDRVGPSKLLFGTDIPGLLAHATYGQLVDQVRHHLAFLSEEDRRLVFGRNAAELFRLSGFERANHWPPRAWCSDCLP